MTQTRPSEALDTSPEGVYRALLRCLRRTKGFGIVFVQCSPAEATRLIERVGQDLPQKKSAVLKLTEPIENLRDFLVDRPDINDLNILFIQGLEKSLEPYIKPGYGGDGDYYNLDTVPKILSHLNQQRENYRDQFSHLCFVFILPYFAVKYFIRRAADFFDWGSGVFELPTNAEIVARESFRIMVEGGYQQYLTWNQAERDQKILEIQSWLREPFQTDEQKAILLFGLGGLFYASRDYQSALTAFNQMVTLIPNHQIAWYSRGNALYALGQNEAAIQSYDQAIAIEPDCHEAWNNRGNALSALGQNEAAIENYDQAIAIKPDYAEAIYNKACWYSLQGDVENAVRELQRAIKLDPESQELAKTDADFDRIRNDDRFQALLSK